MRASPIRLGQARLLALPEGALFWEERRTLVVADLHLAKGAAFARRGVPLPPYDSTRTLERLEALTRSLCPFRVVSLGDAFHREGGVLDLDPQDLGRLQALTGACEWLWVAGNHDPSPPEGLGGRSTTVLDLGGILLRHAPAGDALPEIAGHLHPKARLRVRGRSIARPCFASDQERVLLPAFGSFTGGLDVTAPPIRACCPGAFTAHLLGNAGIHPIPHDRLDPCGWPGSLETLGETPA